MYANCIVPSRLKSCCQVRFSYSKCDHTAADQDHIRSIRFATCYQSSHSTLANGVQHITTAPYHPASNGQADRAVQVFNCGFKWIKEGPVADQISRGSFSCQITPHSTTAFSPAELIFVRKCCSCLDLLLPDLTAKMES